MDKLTYEQRLENTKKEEAEYYNSRFVEATPWPASDFYWEAKRIIERQAEAIRTVWMILYDGDGTVCELENHSNDCEQHLIENGYVPAADVNPHHKHPAYKPGTGI